MTYNLHDFRDDRDAAARVVRAVAPDVLCLQEVPRRLTTELRLPPFVRACGMHWEGGRFGTGGTAVLTGSRVDVLARGRGRLPVRFPDRTRGYAAATVTLRGAGPAAGAVAVVSVHLGLRADERTRHATTLLDRVVAAGTSGANHAGVDPADRLVIAGDLNEGADGGAFAVLAAGRQVVSGGVATFPAGAPTVPLDVIVASPSLGLVQSPPVDVDDHDLATGSDHRPVWVDLDVRVPDERVPDQRAPGADGPRR